MLWIERGWCVSTGCDDNPAGDTAFEHAVSYSSHDWTRGLSPPNLCNVFTDEIAGKMRYVGILRHMSRMAHEVQQQVAARPIAESVI